MSVNAKARPAGSMPSFEAMLNSLGHAVLLIDRGSAIIHANQAAHAAFGPELDRLNLRDLFPHYPLSAETQHAAFALTPDERSRA